jgi:hypothetical protein
MRAWLGEIVVASVPKLPVVAVPFAPFEHDDTSDIGRCERILQEERGSEARPDNGKIKDFRVLHAMSNIC